MVNFGKLHLPGYMQPSRKAGCLEKNVCACFYRQPKALVEALAEDCSLSQTPPPHPHPPPPPRKDATASWRKHWLLAMKSTSDESSLEVVN